MGKIDFAEEFKKRTKKFAIDVIQLFRKMPKTEEARIVGRQILKPATSIASNYRAACRARSDKEFYAKLSIVVEEADETVSKMEIISESGIYKVEDNLSKEANEILFMVARSRKTLRNKINEL